MKVKKIVKEVGVKVVIFVLGWGLAQGWISWRDLLWLCWLILVVLTAMWVYKQGENRGRK